MEIARNWKDYEILDMADGQKLERWGKTYLIRPDPQIIWKKKSFPEKWKQADAIYHRSNSGGGYWEYKRKLEPWQKSAAGRWPQRRPGPAGRPPRTS